MLRLKHPPSQVPLSLRAGLQSKGSQRRQSRHSYFSTLTAIVRLCEMPPPVALIVTIDVPIGVWSCKPPHPAKARSETIRWLAGTGTSRNACSGDWTW